MRITASRAEILRFLNRQMTPKSIGRAPRSTTPDELFVNSLHHFIREEHGATRAVINKGVLMAAMRQILPGVNPMIPADADELFQMGFDPQPSNKWANEQAAMLLKNGSVCVKPTQGTHAQNVIKVRLTDNKISLSFTNLTIKVKDLAAKLGAQEYNDKTIIIKLSADSDILRQELVQLFEKLQTFVSPLYPLYVEPVIEPPLANNRMWEIRVIATKGEVSFNVAKVGPDEEFSSVSNQGEWQNALATVGASYGKLYSDAGKTADPTEIEIKAREYLVAAAQTTKQGISAAETFLREIQQRHFPDYPLDITIPSFATDFLARAEEDRLVPHLIDAGSGFMLSGIDQTTGVIEKSLLAQLTSTLQDICYDLGASVAAFS